MSKVVDMQQATDIATAIKVLSNSLVCSLSTTVEKAPVARDGKECTCETCQAARETDRVLHYYDLCLNKFSDPLLALYFIHERFNAFVRQLVEQAACRACNLEERTFPGCKCKSCSSHDFLLDMLDESYDRAYIKGYIK